MEQELCSFIGKYLFKSDIRPVKGKLLFIDRHFDKAVFPVQTDGMSAFFIGYDHDFFDFPFQCIGNAGF